MEAKAHDMLIGVSKHIIAISIAIIAGLISYVKVLHSELLWVVYAKWSILAGAIAVVFSILLQVSITSFHLNEKNKYLPGMKFYYAVSFFSFMLCGGFGGLFIYYNI